MKISTRLMLLFLVVAVLPMAVFGYLNMQQNEATLRAEALGRMSGLADKKAIQVKIYLAEMVQEVRLLVRGSRIIEAIGVLPKEYVPGRPGAAAYAREVALTRQYFERYVEEAKLFYDVLLITPQGDVVYSQKHETDYATNLMDGPYRNSQLAWAFRAVCMTLEPVISGYEYYAPSQSPALFIAAPVMVDGKFKGVFAVQLSNDLFYRVATDAVGLGLSGEVIFAQRDGNEVLYTMPLRYRNDTAMKFRLGLQQIKKYPMSGALSGESGEGVKTDYRGKQVVAAWRYLPELNWGMVVKIDADEVFAPIVKQRVLLLKTLLGILLFSGLVAYYFSRKIITPLTGLAQTANEVAEGNLDKRADESAPGELGFFASAFNRMAEKLQVLYLTLEDRIKERTRELNISNELLQEEITERKRVEQTLIMESQKNLALLRNASDGIHILDIEGNLIEASDSFCSMLGYQRDEMTGMNVSQWDAMFVSSELPKIIGQQYELGARSQFETRHRRKDGSIFDVEISGYPLELAGKPVMFYSSRDITDRLRAEEELRSASLYARSLIEASLDPLVTISPEGKISDVNDATVQSTGVPRRVLIGSDFSDYFTEPDKAREGYQQVFSQGFVTDYPLSIRHVSGSVIDVLYNASIYRDESGEVAGVFAAARDITERNKAEQEVTKLSLQNRLILDSAGEGIYGLDNDGRCTFVNPAASQLLGFSVKELLGQHGHAMFHHSREDGRPYPQEECPVQAACKQGSVQSGSDLYWRKNGSSFPVEFVSTPILEAGKTTGVVVMFSDITERKRVEEELMRYKDHLEEQVQQRTADLVLARNAAEAANRAKSVFLSNMSHELRTPLNAILGFSNMMRKDPLLPESQRQNLDIINRSGEHLLTLINDVLEMAKIEAGRVQLEDAPFDLGTVVRDVTDMMLIRAKEKGLRLLIDQDSRFPRYIAGDEARLRQVLTNLVGNAVKFTQQGGVTLRLGTKKNKILHLLIEVEDSGPGITPEDQQRVFEPFVQLGEQGDNKGSGLGLTITRQFVQLMDGSISLESTPGKGSLFRVDLPLNEVMDVNIAKQKEMEKGEVAGLAPGQPEYRILIVEDQRDNQLLLTQLMESAGFQVKVAENGKEGVELFESWQPHFIWMDRRMPVMDGLEATRRIRELPGGKEAKIAAVTASAFSEQRTEMLDAGMDDFVRKPYRSNEIYECLSKQLGVRYIYEGMPEPEAQAMALTPEMLSVLPEELRSELTNALGSLESGRIALVIQQVALYDRTLQKTLVRLVGNFDYPAILKALQAVDRDSHDR